MRDGDFLAHSIEVLYCALLCYCKTISSKWRLFKSTLFWLSLLIYSNKTLKHPNKPVGLPTYLTNRIHTYSFIEFNITSYTIRCISIGSTELTVVRVATWWLYMWFLVDCSFLVITIKITSPKLYYTYKAISHILTSHLLYIHTRI